MALWIVEGNIIGEKRCSPVLGFPGIEGIHFTIKKARDAARAIQKINANNRIKILVRYRATKYVPFLSENAT
jgi:hypothetical protein